MFDLEDKENETQQENEKASKLVAEPAGQKPRRSVLKEFDPFAPDSPCPPKQKVKKPDGIIIDEEEIFEDAETSLTSYMCPRNQNIDNTSEKFKTPKNNGTRESWLIQDLRDTHQELVNPNDTADMSYIEAVENLSQADEMLSVDKTSSEEDFEFNSKSHTRNPEILIQNSENDLLNITSVIDKSNGLNQGNIMVDSLEQTFDISNQMNSTIENVQSPMILNDTQPIKVDERSISVKNHISEQTDTTQPRDEVEVSKIKEHGHEGSGSMIDSLELPDSQENEPVSDSTFEKQEILIDSLEVVKSGENLEILSSEEIPSTITAQDVGDKVQDNVLEEKPIVNTSMKQINNQNFSQNVSCNTSDNNLKIAGLDATFDTSPNQKEISILGNSTQVTNHEHGGNAEITLNTCTTADDNLISPEFDITSEVSSKQPDILGSIKDNETLNGDHDAGKNNANMDKTCAMLPTNTVISEANLSPRDKTDATFENQKSLELDTTFEACPTRESLPIIEKNCNQIITSDPKNFTDNVELNKTFEAPFSVSLESKAIQLQSDQINAFNVTIEPNEIFVTTSSNAVESKADQLQNYQMNSSNVNVEHNKTFEASSSDIIESKTDQVESNEIKTSNVIVEFNKTFEATSSDTVESKTDRHQSDEINTSATIFEGASTLEKQSKHDEMPIEKEASTVINRVLDITVDSQENKPIIENTSGKIEEFVNQDGIDLQPVESGIQKNNDCNPECTLLCKLLDTPPNAENRGANGTCVGTELTETSFEISEKVSENTLEPTVLNCEQEATKPEHNIPNQTIINEPHITQDHSVSLKNTIDIDASVEDDIPPDNIEQTNLKRSSSFVPSGSEDVNSTFIAEEHGAETSRVMEALAESLNQTIDVEESAIADDINSPNTSGDLSNEGLNVTIENVKEGFRFHESLIKDKEDKKSEEKTEKGKNNKILARKETEEFEDLERQYNEKTQNKERDAEDAVDDPEAIIKTFGEERVEPELSKVFQRQDTQEFEYLERECTANMQTTKEFSDALRVTEEAAEEPDGAIKQKENDTQNSISLKAALIEPVKEEFVMEKTDLPDKPVIGQVTVRVSGNICNATSMCEESDQINTEDTDKQHFTGINLKYDLNNDKEKLKHSNFEQQSASNIGQNTIEVTMNSKDLDSKKIDKVLTKEGQNSTIVKNDQVPGLSENISRPKSRPECRPSTRSLRNKTQVIDRPISTNDTSKEIKQENGNNHASLDPNECVVKQVDVYKTKSEDLKNQVDRLQAELDSFKNENKRKDKYILSCALDLESERDNVMKFRKQIEEYERTIAKQNEELRRLKEGEEKNAKSLTSLEMAFADVFEKYEKAKTVIGAYRKNEEILQRNIHCAEDQLTKLEAKCSVMKEQYSEKLKKVEEQVMQEKEKYRQDIVKLQAMVKRLEIKSSSLETSLKQKTEECRELAALCDDITGNPM